MKPPSIQPGNRPGAGILLAFLCGLLLAPRAVEAGCGAAMGLASRSASLARLEILGHDAHGPMATPEEGAPAPVPDGVPRCSGPSCSNDVPSPPPSGGLQPAPGRGEALSATQLVAADPPGPLAFPVSDERLDPSAEASRVFHPPRRPS
ncbi:hypothetical protein [Paludisphaera soli]|uniref:hypothetical protein n=1 Tax=Paludisphaera soli TaxID=2712865 RepID=UPI0013ED08A5|nr:hypothetical protein [Paludisphaera soli]